MNIIFVRGRKKFWALEVGHLASIKVREHKTARSVRPTFYWPNKNPPFRPMVEFTPFRPVKDFAPNMKSDLWPLRKRNMQNIYIWVLLEKSISRWI